MSLTVPQIAAGVLAAAAAGIAYAATRTAGPVPMPKYTELRAGPLAEHLVTEAELLVPPARSRIRYPAAPGPGITSAIAAGFAPLYRPPDPQVAALPAEGD